MTKTKWHFNQKTMTKTKSKFAVKMNTIPIIFFQQIQINFSLIFKSHLLMKTCWITNKNKTFDEDVSWLKITFKNFTNPNCFKHLTVTVFIYLLVSLKWISVLIYLTLCCVGTDTHQYGRSPDYLLLASFNDERKRHQYSTCKRKYKQPQDMPN